MLQQTQVAKVIPYFERFLARFPTVLALAAAEESEVLALWAGLGYYSRARLLHRAARSVNGVLPTDVAGWAALPGIGRYTLVGAVRSIAYGEPLALVDGNVLRVFARLYALPLRRGESKAEKEIYVLAQRQLDQEHPDPSAFNQALMELGALLCTPKPKCLLCPLRELCRAHAAGKKSVIRCRRFRPSGARSRCMSRGPSITESCSRSCGRAQACGRGCACCRRRTHRKRWRSYVQSFAGGKAVASDTLAAVERALTHRDVTLTLHRVRLTSPRHGDFVEPSALALPSAFAALVDARAGDA